MPNEPLTGDAAVWKERFRGTVFTWVKIVGNRPERALVISNRDTGVFQLYAWEVLTGELRCLTDIPDGIPSEKATLLGFVAFDGSHAYYLCDEKGTTIGHIVRVPFEGGESEDITPDMKPYTLRGIEASHVGNLLAFNPINQDGFQVCCLNIGPEGQIGDLRRLYQSDHEVWRAIPSHGGEMVAAISTERARMRRYSTLVFDAASGEQIGELWDGLEYSVEAVAFSPVAKDMRLLASTDRTGFVRPVIWDPCTGGRLDLALPELKGDVLPIDWSPDGQQLLLAHFDMATPYLYLCDLADGALTPLRHPTGFLGECADVVGCFGPAGEIFAVWTDATHPQQIIAINPDGETEPRKALAADEIPPGHPWESVAFPSSDGQLIQGWLSVPEREGPFPTILSMHGGPHLVMPESFIPEYQIWPDHGFAFLTINYRGSRTFGKAFKEKIWGDVGHWELEDMIAARNWLVEQGIARPDAVLLQGSSYGGFLTLFALGRRPDLWAGGIAGVPCADWMIAYEDSSDALKAACRLWLGGTPDEKREQYIASSPITYVADVRAPVLIIYAQHDTHTPPRESEAYIEKMRALGKPVEAVSLDAGHFVGDVEKWMALCEIWLRFAFRVIRP